MGYIRSARADGDGYANIDSLGSCPRCGNNRKGTYVNKCAHCSFFCSVCSPNGCPNDNSHPHYDWKPINPD